MSFDIQIIGLEALQSKLSGSKQAEIKEKTQKGIEQAGIIVQTEIKASIAGDRDEPRSVDTEAYEASIMVTNAPMETTISTDIPYAIFLEEGTSKIVARHHFLNSVTRQKDGILAAIAQSIQK